MKLVYNVHCIFICFSAPLLSKKGKTAQSIRCLYNFLSIRCTLGSRQYLVKVLSPVFSDSKKFSYLLSIISTMDSENPLERKSLPKAEIPAKKNPKRQRETDSASTLSPPPKKSQNPQHIITKDYTPSENVISSSSHKNAIVDNTYENDSMACEAEASSSRYDKERHESLGKELDSRLPLPDISPCRSEQTVSHSANSAQVDVLLKGPYLRDQTVNSYCKLYKGSSTDSIDQDVFQGDCVNQDNSMTESGDLSHDVSGTECESLTSSLFLPDDDAGLLGGLEERVLITSKEIPHHKLGEPESSCSTSVSGKIKIQDSDKKRKKKKHSSKKAKEKTEVGEASLKSLRPNYFVGIQISNADVSVCLYPLVCNK